MTFESRQSFTINPEVPSWNGCRIIRTLFLSSERLSDLLYGASIHFTIKVALSIHSFGVSVGYMADSMGVLDIWCEG